jgi:hypothetical protein
MGRWWNISLAWGCSFRVIFLGLIMGFWAP